MINCTNNKYESRINTGDAAATWQEIVNRKDGKKNGSSAGKTKSTTNALYSSSLLCNSSKVHWPPSTANHKTREVGKRAAVLYTTRLAPLQVRSASIRQFMYTYHTAS